MTEPLQRYTIKATAKRFGSGYWLNYRSNPNGEWVKASDALVREQALREELAQLEERLDGCARSQVVPVDCSAFSQDVKHAVFIDTPVLAAKRRAFDYPSQANLDALIAAIRGENEQLKAERSAGLETPPKEADLRYCICADPENCTLPIPGYVCRRGHTSG